MKAIFATLALLLVLVTGAFAQRREETYRLRPEDVVQIQVYNEPQASAQVQVGRDGNITAPFVGIVRAQGKTTVELEADLRQLYIERLRLREPRVSVIITRFRPILATVTGFVGRPGVVEIRPGDTIANLLSKAGGAITDRADLRRATFRRAGTEELIPIDLFALINYGDLTQNYTVEDGDELNVPEESRNRILVLGLVQRPGTFPYKEPMTLADAVSLAGGEIPTRSRFSQTQVFRQVPGSPGAYQRIQVDFVRFIRKGDYSQNIELRPGDMVYVPETNTPDFNRIANTVTTFFFLGDVLRRVGIGLPIIGERNF